MVKILLGFGIGGLAVWLVPRLLGDDSAAVPSISVLLGTALIVGLATTLAALEGLDAYAWAVNARLAAGENGR